MRACLLWFLFPAICLAQAFPTEFPAEAKALEPDVLKQRIAGKVFNVKAADGAEYRVEFKDTHAYLNIYMAGGRTVSDNGPWKAEGSSICIEFQRVKSGCSEYRLVGNTLYSKRASNGEVVVMEPK